MTTYLHLLTVCAALGDEPRACITYAVENRALCEAGMQIAYADLYPDDSGVYISCTQTNVITASPRPKTRPLTGP
jgi:hypothetical protein